MKLRVGIIFLILMLIFPVISAVTGEVITGDVPSAPSEVSVFVQPSSPVIRLFSPENITYYDVTSVLVNYTIGNSIESVWYNLDNSANISLFNDSSGSFNIDTSLGDHVLFLYANNSLGESMEEVSFFVSDSTPPESPPGGGGGGGSTPSVSEFSLDQDIIQVIIKQGENKRKILRILNIGNTILNFNLDFKELQNFLIISEDTFSLQPGEGKDINVDIFAKEEEIVDSYVGRLIVEAGGKTKFVNFIIDVQGKQPLFDMVVKVLTKIVEPGEEVKIDLNMINIGDLNNFDILLYYSIRDFEGNTLLFKEESIAIDKELDLIRKIFIPEEIDYGVYVLYAKISYGNLMASGTDVFQVGKRKPSVFYLGLIIVFCLIVALIIHLQGRKNKLVK